MKIIGLTGGIGCGKSEASKIFIELGVNIIDVDKIARNIVCPGSDTLKKIENHFGDQIIELSGSLDRKKLREIIFNEESEKKWLEELTHPVIHKEISKELKKSKNNKEIYRILEFPLLLKKPLYQNIHRLLLIDASPKIQLKRTILRDKSNETLVKSIMKNQMDQHERRLLADYIINNESSLSELRKKIIAFHKKYIDFLG